MSSPVKNPLEILASFGLHISSLELVTGALIGIVVLWLLYTAVVTYHWLRYSHGSLVALPVLATHVVISLILIGYAVTGLPTNLP